MFFYLDIKEPKDQGCIFIPLFIHFFCLPKRNESKKRAPRRPNKSFALSRQAYAPKPANFYFALCVGLLPASCRYFFFGFWVWIEW